MAANNFITTTTLWDTEKKKSLFVQNTAKISPPQPLWKKNGRSGFCDSVHVSTRPSSRVQMMPKPWQNMAKKQCVTWGYTLPYCTLNVSGSLIPVGESHDPHESPGTSSASWCVMPLAALHTWSFWGRCKAGRAIGPLWAIGEIELGLNEWDLGVSYSWTKPRNLDLPRVCYFIHVFVVDWLSISSFCFRMMLEHWDLDGLSYGVLVYWCIGESERLSPHKRGIRRWHARPQTSSIQEFEGKRVMLLAAGRRSFTGLRLESI